MLRGATLGNSVFLVQGTSTLKEDIDPHHHHTVYKVVLQSDRAIPSIDVSSHN